MTMPAGRGAPVLTIDLAALVANWRQLRDRVAPAECAAAVKADGYGLGAVAVAGALEAAGCRTFFVAHLDEALILRRALPAPRIAVLHGVPDGAEAEFVTHRLVPVLSEIGQVRRWAERSAGAPGFLQLDSGMTRLGLDARDVRELAADRTMLDALGLELVMSHLAAADEPSSPMSCEQLRAFEDLASLLPPMPRSLANSSGIFLAPEFHMDLARPGAALYGINPLPGSVNPMREVVRFQAPIVQLRQTETTVRVGYSATQEVGPGRRIATVAVGYADGYPRALSNRGHVAIGGRIVPLLGRVSMDLITVDVTDLPPGSVAPGAMVDLFGGGMDLDQVAAEAGTIGYEILTRLSRRATRRYLPASASVAA